MRKKTNISGVYKLINKSSIADVNVGSVSGTLTIDGVKPLSLSKQKELEVFQFIKNYFYGDINKLSKAIEDFKSNDAAFKAMQAVRKDTVVYSHALDKLKQKIATTTSTGGTRRQKFGRNKLAPLVPLISGTKQINDLPDLNWILRQKKISFEDEDGNKKPLTGVGLHSYMQKNNIKHVVDIIKAWPKDKSLKIPSWEILILYLKTLNFKPEEVFDYAVNQINTKKRYLEHRLYRDIEDGAHKQLKDFIEAYKPFRNSPLKNFFGSEPLNKWSQKYNILFKSAENLRVNLKLMIKAWNEKNPTDKINL
jgi:hypothetical protein